MGAYSASKFAVKAYTEVLRIEVNKADLPIAVSLVKPSGIDTPIATHAAVHADGHRAMLPPPVLDMPYFGDHGDDWCDRPNPYRFTAQIPKAIELAARARELGGHPHQPEHERRDDRMVRADARS